MGEGSPNLSHNQSDFPFLESMTVDFRALFEKVFITSAISVVGGEKRWSNN